MPGAWPSVPRAAPPAPSPLARPPPSPTSSADPVPQEFYKDGANRVPEYVWSHVKGAIEDMEDDLAAEGLKFASEDAPLLVSVRSGAAMSMPGMMNTVLNLGLNDRAVLGLAKRTNDRFAWDCYRR